eukprot:6289038-Karenia_brevis.AAC.1
MVMMMMAIWKCMHAGVGVADLQHGQEWPFMQVAGGPFLGSRPRARDPGHQRQATTAGSAGQWPWRSSPPPT